MNFSVKVVPGDEYDRFIAERTRPASDVTPATVTAAGAPAQTSAAPSTSGSRQ